MRTRSQLQASGLPEKPVSGSGDSGPRLPLHPKRPASLRLFGEVNYIGCGEKMHPDDMWELVGLLQEAIVGNGLDRGNCRA